MCRLTDLLMEKSGFCVYFLCSMGAKRVCECEYVNAQGRSKELYTGTLG